MNPFKESEKDPAPGDIYQGRLDHRKCTVDKTEHLHGRVWVYFHDTKIHAPIYLAYFKNHFELVGYVRKTIWDHLLEEAGDTLNYRGRVC